jgi:hypothetical protein
MIKVSWGLTYDLAGFLENIFYRSEKYENYAFRSPGRATASSRFVEGMTKTRVKAKEIRQLQ